MTGVVAVRSSRQLSVLVGVQLAAGLVSFAFVFAGSMSDGMETGYQVLLGSLWTVLSLFTYMGWRRLPFWFVDVSLLGSGLLLSVSVTFTPSPVVQIVDGVGLIGFGVFAAYQLSGRRLALFLTVSTVAYLMAVARSQVLQEPFVAVIVMIVFVLSTIHVWYLVQRLRDVAVTDPLTGALNRKGLVERAVPIRALADRSGNPASVVVIDLDHFKQFNDKYGHAAGDHLLADLVTSWREVLRPTDLVARIGGDEFVVVLPNCGPDQVDTTVARLHSVSGSGWTAGAVTWREGLSVMEAIDEADQVMYAAKQDRR